MVTAWWPNPHPHPHPNPGPDPSPNPNPNPSPNPSPNPIGDLVVTRERAAVLLPVAHAQVPAADQPALVHLPQGRQALPSLRFLLVAGCHSNPRRNDLRIG